MAVVAAVALLGGCDSGGKPAAAPVSATPTPIQQLDTVGVGLPRIDFCKLVPNAAVHDALDSTTFAVSSYGNGDTAPVSTDDNDVVHELACSYTPGSGSSAAAPSGTPTPSPSGSPTGGSAGTSARAWMFGSPVDRSLARTVIRDARARHGCRVVTGAAPFGDPTMLQTCRGQGEVRVRYAGLFGDTWLTCEVSAPAPAEQVTARAGAWCVAVESVLRTTN